jgi:hypothetical protein
MSTSLDERKPVNPNLNQSLHPINQDVLSAIEGASPSCSLVRDDPTPTRYPSRALRRRRQSAAQDTAPKARRSIRAGSRRNCNSRGQRPGSDSQPRTDGLDPDDLIFCLARWAVEGATGMWADLFDHRPGDRRRHVRKAPSAGMRDEPSHDLRALLDRTESS